MLLYAGVPAEAGSVFALYSLTVSQGTTLVTQYLRVLFPILTALGFLPLAIILSFIPRVIIVTQRTAATISFTTLEQEL